MIDGATLTAGDLLITTLLLVGGWILRRIIGRLDCHDRRLAGVEVDTRVLLDRSDRRHGAEAES